MPWTTCGARTPGHAPARWTPNCWTSPRPRTPPTALEALATERALFLIASLPPDQAQAVLLRVVVGLDAASAARVLGKRAGAVRTAAYRGLKRLARLLS